MFDITLHVAPGEVYGYLGPNGAGKSTTLRHMMGFGRPDFGRITVRARTNIEDMGGGRSRIIVTEIPYQVNKAMLVK